MKSYNHFVFMDRLFEGAQVNVAISKLHGTAKDLLPLEMEYVRNAVPKRVREYATARLISRELLSYHDIYNFPLLNDQDRVPVWPENILGSIAHCKEFCIVAIANFKAQDQLLGIGVDVEPEKTIEQDLWSIILRDDELDQIEQPGVKDKGVLVRHYFCAKEAVYKSIFPKIRKIIEFRDLEIKFFSDTNHFEAKFYDHEIQQYLRVNKSLGKLFIHEGHVFTGARTYL